MDAFVIGSLCGLIPSIGILAGMWVSGQERRIRLQDRIPQEVEEEE